MTTHHLSDELLEDYTRGHLTTGWAVGVASHLALCPTCRARAQALEALGGVLLDDIEPAKVTDGAFDRLMDRMNGETSGPSTSDHGEKNEPISIRARGKVPTLPEPLRGLVGGDVDALKWRRLNGDVAQVLIETDDPTTMCRLLRVKAGRPVAEHSHGGTEFTLVLSGSFSDALGTFGRGDIELTDETVEHQPVAGNGEDCICFAVTDAPLRFRNPIVRLLQPLFRI